MPNKSFSISITSPFKLKENFATLENEKENLNSRMEKLTNVLFVERIRTAENTKNTFELINLMKETIIGTEEMKDRLNFFAENQKLNDILSAFVGEEFTYYEDGKLQYSAKSGNKGTGTYTYYSSKEGVVSYTVKITYTSGRSDVFWASVLDDKMITETDLGVTREYRKIS